MKYYCSVMDLNSYPDTYFCKYYLLSTADSNRLLSTIGESVNTLSIDLVGKRSGTV